MTLAAHSEASLQLALPFSVEVGANVLAEQGELEVRGAVFTRVEVVDFILDIAGYAVGQPLHKKRVLEPSFGGGNFLLPMISRLFVAWRASAPTGTAQADLAGAIRAVELHGATFAATRAMVIAHLVNEGLSGESSVALADCWLVQDDFLLAPLDRTFDFVLGNPPYVRQELIPALVLAEYRRRYATLYDRADLYIPFIERSLLLLSNGGCVGFICADRWMKNRYGGPLRKLVADNFHLKMVVDMTDTPAFHSDVIAYPAITVISREKRAPTRIAFRPKIEAGTLLALSAALRAGRILQDCSLVRQLDKVTDNAQPWLLGSSDQTALIRRLEENFPTLEEAACKVSIGVATGADRAFIGDFDAMDVAPDRKVRLVTTDDIMSGEVRWRGQGVINPFADEGGLVDLRHYPRLARYLEVRRDVIAERHCAKKTPMNW